jgi:hypothetical protein
VIPQILNVIACIDPSIYYAALFRSKAQCLLKMQRMEEAAAEAEKVSDTELGSLVLFELEIANNQDQKGI